MLTEQGDAAIADHILRHCGSLKAGEKLVLVADETTTDMVAVLRDQAEEIGASVQVETIAQMAMHGNEPPESIAAAMSGGDLVIGMTAMSLAHTRARHEANRKGARYLSMPDYSWPIFRDPSVLTDYRSREADVRRVADVFSAGSEAHVTTALGTDMRLDIRDRLGNCCPGFVEAPGSLGSPPDIEANVAPIENGSNGVVIVDGSIPCREVGMLKTPVRLTVVNGLIKRFEGDAEVVATLEGLFEGVGTKKSRVLAECGVGMNLNAVLQGNMLTDEGASGCMHFGFGANATIGGANAVPFHLDFVFRSASLHVDGKAVIENGNLLI